MTVRSSKQLTLSLLACLVVILVWFSPWWITGKNLAPLDVLHEMLQPWRGESETVTVKNHFVADAVDQYLVYRMIAAESYRREGWMGWSSLTYGGVPQYANTMALYYDWTMQLHRWFDFWTSWHLGLMGQVLLAAFGMLIFLRNRSLELVWCVCGALAYACNSQFVVWIYHRWTLGAFCWVPWIFWSIDSYRAGNKGFWMLVPIFTGLALLGGTLQHAALVCLALIASWLGTLFGHNAVQSSDREKVPRTLRTFGCYSAWGVLGVGLAGMMLLPCSSAFVESSRLGLHTGTFANTEGSLYPQGAMQPMLNCLAYPLQIFPSLLGTCQTLDVLKAFKSELFYIAYFGSLPVLISFVACFRKQTPPLARILIFLGLLLPLTPVVRYLYQRLFILYIFGGVLAFADFMDKSTDKSRWLLFRFTGSVALTGTLLWTVLSIAYTDRSDSLIYFLESRYLEGTTGSSFGYFRSWMEGRFSSFVSNLFVWSPQQLYPLGFLFLALFGLRITISKHSGCRQLGSWIVAFAVVSEVTLFASRWVTFTDPAKYALFPTTPEVTAIQQHAGTGRLTTLNDETGGHMANSPFIPNTLSAYGVQSLLGYDSIVPNGMAVNVKNQSDSLEVGRVGVTHLISFPNNPKITDGWRKCWENHTMVLYENLHPVPRYIGFTSISSEESFFGSSTTGDFVGLTEETHKENTRLISVPVGITGLRIAENHADGWEYQLVDGPFAVWNPVQRAQDASMVIRFDHITGSGGTKVLMRYNPPLRRAGLWISGSSFILIIFSGLVISRKSKGLLAPCSQLRPHILGS